MVLLSIAVGGSRLQDSSVTWGQEYMGDKTKALGIHHVAVPPVLVFPASLLLLSSFQSPVVIVCSLIPSMGLPQRLSSKDAACQCRRHRSDPWSRKTPRAMEQLSPCPATSEAVL